MTMNYGPKPETKDQAVTMLMEWMSTGQYKRGDLKALAAAWGMSYWTCSEWTEEAGIRVRSVISDQYLTAIVEQRLDEIQAENDPKDRVAALKAMLEARGLKAPGQAAREAVPSASEEKLIEEAVRRALKIPRMRELILAEVARQDATLLTEGVAIDESA